MGSTQMAGAQLPALGRLDTEVAIGQLMDPHVFWVRPGAALRDVAQEFRQRGINAAPVLDDAGRPMGVITASHLGQAGLEGAPVDSDGALDDDGWPLDSWDDAEAPPPPVVSDLALDPVF